MDIVEFVEKVCKLPLLDSQKEFVRKIYDATKNDKRLYCIPPSGNQNFNFELLQAIVLVVLIKEVNKMKVPKIDWKPFDKDNPPTDLADDQTCLILL